MKTLSGSMILIKLVRGVSYVIYLILVRGAPRFAVRAFSSPNLMIFREISLLTSILKLVLVSKSRLEGTLKEQIYQLGDVLNSRKCMIEWK